MYKNYFLVAVRSFKKDRVNTLISLAGLITGLACVMLIVAYIHYETSFDKSYSNAGRIYRILTASKNSIDNRKDGSTPQTLSPAMVREIPEVTSETAISKWPLNLQQNNQSISLDNARVYDNFFSIFNFNILQGNASYLLNDKNKIVLTASAALKLFKTTNVVGKVLSKNDTTKYIISGVVEDLPKNSFLSAESFTMKKRPEEALDELRGYSSVPSFVLLSKNVSLDIVVKKLNLLCKSHRINSLHFDLQPVQDIHLYSADIKDSSFNTGDIKYVYIYGCIALLILLIGCINFINLTIARSLERTREVGVRKVLGAQKKQLMAQFMSEAALYFIVSIPIALLLACFCWNGFTHLLNINADVSFLFNNNTILIIIGICLLAIILSSLYPAFFLSRLQPVNTLKGGFINGLNMNIGLRKVLTIVQFAISIALIAATIVIHAQLRFLNDEPLGFNKNNLLNFYLPYSAQNGAAFKNELLSNPNIQSVTYSGLNIAKNYGATGTNDDPKDSTKQLHFAFINADFDFIKTFQISIYQGRDFSADYPSDLINYDSLFQIQLKDNRDKKVTGEPTKNPALILAKQPIIITEDMAKALELNNPVGQTINMSVCHGTIIGIIKEFNGISLKEKNPFIVIRCYPEIKSGQVYARINAANTNATITYISKKYKQFLPKEPFQFSFVDDTIAHLYYQELRLTNLFNIFALLAIILSGMGLFSLVSLMVSKRTKEIGIRKIVGASVNDIVVLIAKGFIVMIAISFVIATPVTYLVMNKWLQGYIHRTTLYWWVFLIAGIGALLIAFISISFKSIIAAKANPVKSLRTE